MRKTILSIATLMTLMPATFLKAAELPDEINHPPYYSEYVQLRDQRDQTASNLQGANQRLASILASIQRENSNITRLQDSIQRLESERSNLQYELPQVQAEQRQTYQEASATQSAINDLTDRMNHVASQSRDARVLLERIEGELRREQGQHREFSVQLRKGEGEKVGLEQFITKLDKYVKQMEQQIRESERAKQNLVQREQELRAEITKLTQDVAAETTQINEIQDDIRATAERSNELNQKLREAQAKLQEMQASNADPADIEKMKQRIQEITEKGKELVQREHRLAQRLEGSRRQLKGLQDQLAKSQREVQGIPAEIAKQDQSIRQAQHEIRDSQGKLSQTMRQVEELERVLQDLRRRLHRVEGLIARLNEDHRNQSAIVTDLDGRYNSLAANQQAQRDHLNGLNQRINDMSRRISTIEARIPEIGKQIDSNHDQIAASERSIDSSQINQHNTEVEITGLESRLANLSAQTDSANTQYTQRQALYDQYLEQAAEIGRSQTGPASSMGSQKGDEIAAALSSKYADQLGLEVGRFEANLIGLVRGEIQGYPAGYKVGFADPASRQQGQAEGRTEGMRLAHVYAQANFKPNFFDKYLNNVIDSGVVPTGMPKSAFVMAQGEEEIFTKGIEEFENLGPVANLSQAEIVESQNTTTSLDARIHTALTSEGQVWERSRSYSDSGFVYEAPTAIPYQKVDCATVYKKVADFIANCKQSYANSFKDIYLTESQEQFGLSYPGQYNEKFAAKEGAVRAEAFTAEFKAAETVAFAEARANGQKDAFNLEFTTAKDVAYQAEMPAATQKADADAKTEVGVWVAGNPVVTVGNTGFSSDVVRGGQAGALAIDLKNLGGAASLATGTLTLKAAGNLNFASQTYRLVDVAARGNSALQIPFTVNSNARSGEVASATVEFTLPGHKYKPTRVESKNFQIKLSVNPTTKSTLKYDVSPKVKGFTSYYIHMFDFTMSPAVENVVDGYTVKIEAAADSAAHIDFKETSAASRALNVGQSFTGRFRYVFKVSARGKAITLYLNTFHKGVLIEKKPIVIKPY